MAEATANLSEPNTKNVSPSGEKNDSEVRQRAMWSWLLHEDERDNLAGRGGPTLGIGLDILFYRRRRLDKHQMMVAQCFYL
jgi:hypothetical protein